MNETLEQEQYRVDEVTQKMAYEEQIIEEDYDQTLLKAQQDLLKTANLKIKDGNEDALRESSFRVKQHEDELLLQEHQLEQLERQKQVLAQMKTNPYFGRIDFKDDLDEETIYLGIASFSADGKQYVYDWRAPVANLFYTDRLGKHAYEVDGETYPVDVIKKRQFIIKDRQIQVMEDTDAMIGDDVLLTVLSDESTDHMKNIVSTIQADQNKLIRDNSRYLLIEGVAGSGKTSVLMQRIAYLLYQERQDLSADDLLMLSPNPIFSEYVSQVLPSLGEENIYRTEFNSLLQELSRDELIEAPERFASLQEWLASLAGVQAFAKYLDSLQIKGLQFKHLYRDEETLLVSRKQLSQLFHQTSADNQVWQRLEALQNYLIRYIQKRTYDYARSEEMEKRMDVEGAEIYDQIMAENPALSFDEAKEQLANALAEMTFADVFMQVKRMQWINYRMQYIHFLTFLQSEVPAELQPVLVAYIDWVKQAMKHKQLTAIDAKYYLMLQKILAHKTMAKSYQWLFIDEIQDYTPLDLKCLITLYPEAKYTMAGDVNQLIFHNQHALMEMDDLFKEPVKRGELLTSYRSTAEITTLASAILHQDSIATVARHGEVPALKLQPTLHEMKKLVNNEGRTAIITRSVKEAEAFYQQFKEDLPGLVQLTPGHLATNQSLFVLPLELAKGLEFDNVILLGVDRYQLDQKNDQIELYTAVTRAMHHLVLVADHKTEWLADLQQQSLLK